MIPVMIPVSAILLGTIILGEHLELQHIVGMGFIGLGLIAIDGRLFGYNGLRDIWRTERK